MRFLYYVILIPLSRLPIWVLYRISDFLYLFFLYGIIGYRRKLVRSNIQNSFPDYTKKQQLTIERKFYAHFCDTILESIKAFTISKAELEKRFVYINPEILIPYYERQQSLTLVGGHYGNWELYAVTAALHMQHLPIALYKPLANKFLNRKIKESRSKFGLLMKNYAQMTSALRHDKENLYSVIFAGDQCPSYHQKPHWTTFLHQETGVQMGAEKFAREFNTPVIYGVITKPKRGYYHVEYKLICEFPNELPLGAITEMHTRELEKDIINEPAYWLWSHNRWKRKRIDFDRYREKLATKKISKT